MTPPDADSVSWLRFVFASFTIITLLALLAWGLKYASLHGWLSPTIGKSKRLRVTSTLALDARRRVVVVQKDDREYTLLLGGGSDVLLDTATCGTKAADDIPRESKG